MMPFVVVMVAQIHLPILYPYFLPFGSKFFFSSFVKIVSQFL